MLDKCILDMLSSQNKDLLLLLIIIIIRWLLDANEG